MRRPGDIALPFPKGVEIKNLPEGKVQVKGPRGTLFVQLPPGLVVKIESENLMLEQEQGFSSKKFFGLFRALLKNSIIGVTEGFEKKLTMIGVGYRAAVAGDKLDLQIGKSHPTLIPIPKTLQVSVDKGTSISIKGSDKHEVGQFAATVRSKKPPEPYKGKGIRYENEYVRKKEGKAAKGKS